VRQSRTLGSVRGAARKGGPYRDYAPCESRPARSAATSFGRQTSQIGVSEEAGLDRVLAGVDPREKSATYAAEPVRSWSGPEMQAALAAYCPPEIRIGDEGQSLPHSGRDA
jgi:hypothetical protein